MVVYGFDLPGPEELGGLGDDEPGHDHPNDHPVELVVDELVEGLLHRPQAIGEHHRAGDHGGDDQPGAHGHQPLGVDGQQPDGFVGDGAHPPGPVDVVDDGLAGEAAGLPGVEPAPGGGVGQAGGQEARGSEHFLELLVLKTDKLLSCLLARSNLGLNFQIFRDFMTSCVVNLYCIFIILITYCLVNFAFPKLRATAETNFSFC